MSEPLDDDPTPRAAPGKRPPAPIKPAAKPGVMKSAPPAEAAEPRLNWGHVGSITKPGRLSDGTSRPGVIRIVEANISYNPPPLDPYIWSSASLKLVNQYEMAWPEGNPADVRSLADLGADLRSARPSRALLETLDHAADVLLGIAASVHSHGNRLGLLHPENVLLVPRSDGRQLVLPDTGFTWRGSHGQFPWKDSPSRPRYLNDDPRENPLARLWDNEPVRQQFTRSTDADENPELVPAESDLKTIARVFAAVLTGRVERDLQPPNAAHTWSVLRSVLKGEITSAEQFRARLAEHALSEHWLAPNPVTKGAGSAVVALGVLIICLIAAGAGGLYFAGVFDKKPSDTSLASSTNPSNAVTPKKPTKSGKVLPPKEVDWKNQPTSQPTGIEDLIKQFQATTDPRQRIELLVKMYQFYEAADEPTRTAIAPWIEHLRGVYLADWEKRYNAADEQVIKNIALRFESGQQIYNLNQELTGLRQQYEPISPSLNDKENECLLISDLRSRELGSAR